MNKLVSKVVTKKLLLPLRGILWFCVLTSAPLILVSEPAAASVGDVVTVPEPSFAFLTYTGLAAVGLLSMLWKRKK